MAAFEYTSLDKQGRRHKGIIEADSPRHVRQILRDKMLTPMTIHEASGHIKRTDLTKGLTKPTIPRIKLRDLSIVTRQLATLIDSGLPVEQALHALSKQSQIGAVSTVLASIRAKVLEGHTLAESLSGFPSSFSDLYRASIHAGERTGHLAAVLEYLADFTDSTLQSRQKIQLALLYPAILTTVSLLIIIFLLAYIVPGMVRVFSDTGHSLPLLTRALISISVATQHYGVVTLATMFAIIIGIRNLLKRPTLTLRLDKSLLQWPIIGSLTREHATARFASTLGMLQESGVSLLQALEISSTTTPNRYIRSYINLMTQKVSEGVSLSKAIEHTNIFNPLLATMVASGEASGQLGHMLTRASTMIQKNVENRIALLLGLFEPLVLLVMGGVVLLLVLAIILPILHLNQMV